MTWEQEVKNIFDAQSPTALYVTLELLKQTKEIKIYTIVLKWNMI